MNTENTPAGSDDHTDHSESRATPDDDGSGTDETVGGQGENGNGNGNGDRSESESEDHDVVAYLVWGAVAGLGLVALVAVFRFYFAASRAIGIWISPDFEPLFQAAFNLVVLLLAATGIVFFARRFR